MPVNVVKYNEITQQLKLQNVQLVAVSKLQPVKAIKEMYDLGQRDFGENYVQELLDKQGQLPNDIKWHFIGHLQSNKVKYIVPFIHLIHGVDSLKLLKEINKQGRKINRKIACLLQMHIAMEETKFGMDEGELDEVVEELGAEESNLNHVLVKGLMGMASFTDDQEKVKDEMKQLNRLYKKYSNVQKANICFDTLSMGMSGDYALAIKEGSTMVRIGSLLFGNRQS